MEQIWLRCFLVDPKSGKVIERWDDHPLPPYLRVRHLRSFLEQRFGRPLSPAPDASGGFAFAAPGGSKKAILVAIPAKRDARNGELVAVFERFERLKALAASLGMPGAVDSSEFESNEQWNGPLFDAEYTRRLA